MTCRLSTYIAEHGNAITVGHQTFRIQDLRKPEGLDDLYWATACSTRASYVAMQTRDRVIGEPTAEVWSILMGKRFLNFAVTDKGIRKMSY